MFKHFREITFNKLKYIGEGAFGQYYRIKGKRRGVKLIKNQWFASKENAIQVFNDSSFAVEFKDLKRISKRSKFVPKGYCPVVVKQYNPVVKFFVYYVGYMMQHVDGHRIDRWNLSLDKLKKLEEMEEKFKKQIGAQYLVDHHDGNILQTKKGFVFIDAGRFCA